MPSCARQVLLAVVITGIGMVAAVGLSTQQLPPGELSLPVWLFFVKDTHQLSMNIDHNAVGSHSVIIVIFSPTPVGDAAVETSTT